MTPLWFDSHNLVINIELFGAMAPLAFQNFPLQRVTYHDLPNNITP